jgi:pectate lyase
VADAIGIAGTSTNFICDHITASWGWDETFSITSNGFGTIQNSIISEGMNDLAPIGGENGGERHAFGSLAGGNNLSFFRNLMAHFLIRMPSITSSSNIMDIRNCVIYNWQSRPVNNGSLAKANLVNNYFKPGPATIASGSVTVRSNFLFPTGDGLAGTYGKFYCEGNVVEGTDLGTTVEDQWRGVRLENTSNQNLYLDDTKNRNINGDIVPFEIPVDLYEDQIVSANQAYIDILQDAGMNINRDSVDIRIINEVTTGTVTYTGATTGLLGILDTVENQGPNNQNGTWPELVSGTSVDLGTSGDGIPDSWKISNGLTINTNYGIAGTPETHAYLFSPDGYRWIEVYSHWLIDENNEFTLTLSSNNVTMGTVSRIPETGSFDNGESVQLIANENEGFRFQSWREGSVSGPILSNNLIYNHVMNSNITIIGVFLLPTSGNKKLKAKINKTPPLANTELAGGWADLHIDGIVTGGASGSTYFFNESSSRLSTRNSNMYSGFDAMWTFIGDNPTTPMTVIWNGGDVNLLARNYGIGNNAYPYRIPQSGEPILTIENKTVMTSAGQKFIGGSFQFKGWKNCIIRNWVRMGDGQGGEEADYLPHGGNGMGFTNCQRLWVDHCELDSEATIDGTGQLTDASLDFGEMCDYVTVSNCYIRRSEKTSLISYSDEDFNDRGKLRITYRNNLWENNHLRQPYARFGKIHHLNSVFRYNPVFTASPTQYPWARIIEIGVESQFYSQGNKYYGHRYCLMDRDWDNVSALSGFITDNDWSDPSPTFSSFNGVPGTTYKGLGNIRPENVTWNPNTIPGYSYPLGLMTPDQAEVYVLQWAGAKYHNKIPVVFNFNIGRGFGVEVDGGGSATPIVITTKTQFEDNFEGSNKVLDIRADINLDDIQYAFGSNITIKSTTGARIQYGQFRFESGSNAKIENIERRRSYNDLMSFKLWEGVLIKHCKFDGETSGLWVQEGLVFDGLVDFGNGVSDNITVMFCQFLNHNKAMLLGSELYTGLTKASLLWNYWYNCYQRFPRTAMSNVDLTNNYILACRNGVGLADNGNIRGGNNYYKDCNTGIDYRVGTELGAYYSATGDIFDNVTNGTTLIPEPIPSWTIPSTVGSSSYAVTPLAAADVPAFVLANSGNILHTL